VGKILGIYFDWAQNFSDFEILNPIFCLFPSLLDSCPYPSIKNITTKVIHKIFQQNPNSL
jgi:hypothetical protein